MYTFLVGNLKLMRGIVIQATKLLLLTEGFGEYEQSIATATFFKLTKMYNNVSFERQIRQQKIEHKAS